MSLIQEALRRQDSDGPPKLQPDELSIGPPPVPPMRPPQEDTGSKTWIVIVIVAVVMLGLLGGSIALLSFVAKSASRNRQQNKTQEVIAVGQSVEPVVAEKPVPKKVVVPEQAVAKEKQAPQPVVKEETVAATVPTQKEQPQATPEVKPEVVRRDSKNQEKLEEEEEAGDWPVIQLTGVLTKARQEDSAAIINGEIIFVGDQYGGIEILEVNATGVLMEYKGKKRFLRVGRTMR